MPSLKKKALSLYIRNGCQRQLLLNLYSPAERKSRGLPVAQDNRAGAGYAGVAGYEWQDKVVGQLVRVFGTDHIVQNTNRRVKLQQEPIELQDALPGVLPNQFIVEGHYDANTDVFKTAVGFDNVRDQWGDALTIGNAYPDLIQVLPSMQERPTWEREREARKMSSRTLAVLPNGDTVGLDDQDGRLRLRVIDIKLASDPGAHYFAEVVYYSVTLAAWILQEGLDDHFVVIAAPAVWPGSYEDSALAKARVAIRAEMREPQTEELAEVLEDDIEVAPFDVFAPRLTRFFRSDLPHILSRPWETLDWHVNYKCNGCEFLGYPWLGKPSNDKKHCWPTAERTSHLSRVVGLTRGMVTQLAVVAPDVPALAAIASAHPVFDGSPALRAKRSVLPARARSLRDGTSGLIPDSGGDALMPKWPSLRVFVFLDYDLSSAITVSFALRAYWKEPLPMGSPFTAKSAQWTTRRAGETADDGADDGGDGGTANRNVTTDRIGSDDGMLYRLSCPEVFLVDERSPQREGEELLKFLHALRAIFDAVLQADEADTADGRRKLNDTVKKEERSTYQLFLWDEAQRKHLVRLVGRHLPKILADPKLRDLAWLFPPAELLGHPDEASYKSPFTMVSGIVQRTVAVGLPHHYTLLEVARWYKPDHLNAVSVHPLYQEALSDVMPGERIYEFWDKRKGDNFEKMARVRETARKKLSALALVTGRLWKDLQPRLNKAAAPPLIRPDRRLAGVSPQGLLWYEFSRLNHALAELEEHAIRAMPSHEREARFKSAYLRRRLEGNERAVAVAHFATLAGEPVKNADELIVYTLNEDSDQFNVRPPALGFALSPRGDGGFLNSPVYPLVEGTDWKGNPKGSVAEAGLTQVSVVALDRVGRLIALRPWWAYAVPLLESLGKIDLSADVMLDSVGEDYLSKKIKMTVENVGWTASAQHEEMIMHALGTEGQTPTSLAPECPASEFLWQATRLAGESVMRDPDAAWQTLVTKAGVSLNDSQKAAWESALTRRMTLIWGPPGTGKSQTLRAVIAGAVWDAHQAGRPLRILVSSQTYNAVDNVLLGADGLLAEVLPDKPYRLFRLQSDYNEPPATLAKHPHIEPIGVKSVQTPPNVIELQTLLQNREGIVVVGAPSQQIHNLAQATKNKSKPSLPAQKANTKRLWFDLVIIDEASQLDVAESCLIASKAAEGASFVLAGDDLQLPPIHAATAPENLDDLVGSVYGYVRHHQGVAPMPLQVNYRSSKTLVDFTRRAGYDQGLRAYHEDLRLWPLKAFPTDRPVDWPDALYWTPEWSRLLEPDAPAVCFVYADPLTGQVNDFEADAVAALLYLLYGRMDRQLAGEREDDSGVRPAKGKPYDTAGFWKKAVGVVTPHKAQMARVVKRLHHVFPQHDSKLIWDAVDTVERFQGQERDVIIASFGLGDPDLIEAEDKFLFNLNRFNVTASRARAKLIVLTTRSLVDHVSNDGEVLEHSRLIKSFVDTFCMERMALTLGYIDGSGTTQLRSGDLKRRG